MITFLLELLRLLPFLVGGHRQLALENLALRQQLAVYKRTAPRPKLHSVPKSAAFTTATSATPRNSASSVFCTAKRA